MLRSGGYWGSCIKKSKEALPDSARGQSSSCSVPRQVAQSVDKRGLDPCFRRGDGSLACKPPNLEGYRFPTRMQQDLITPRMISLFTSFVGLYLINPPGIA